MKFDSEELQLFKNQKIKNGFFQLKEFFLQDYDIYKLIDLKIC